MKDYITIGINGFVACRSWLVPTDSGGSPAH